MTKRHTLTPSRVRGFNEPASPELATALLYDYWPATVQPLTRVAGLRYGSLADAPVEPQMLLQSRRPEDEGSDVWRIMNTIQDALVRGGVSDWHRDRRGKLRSVRALRGIDSKVGLNKGLWGLMQM